MARDAQRFIMVEESESATSEIHLVLNAFEALKGGVPLN